MRNFIMLSEERIFPSKIVCVGRNYVEHIKELNNEMPENLVLFNKPNSALSGELLYFGEHCRFEGEICFLIKDKKIDAIGFGLDLTKADVQNYLKSKSLPWERAKAFDNSAVMSEFIKFNGDIKDIKMKLFINNILVQEANYELMIYKPDVILNEIQTFMSLEDDDIIMSGTPKGVGNYKIGDEFIGQIYLKDEMILEQKWVVKEKR